MTTLVLYLSYYFTTTDLFILFSEERCLLILDRISIYPPIYWWMLVDALSRSGYTALNGRKITELESMWKEAVVACLKAICLDGPRQTLKDSETDGIG